MIKVTGNPFAPISQYLGAVGKNVDRVYLESAAESGNKVAEELNQKAASVGAPAIFKTYHDPNHGVITGPAPDHPDTGKVFDKEFGTLKESPTGFVRGTLGTESGEHFSRVFTQKIGRVRP